MRPKILAVDDTPANIKLLTDVLASAGYDVVAARNGEEALKKLGTEAPDLVLLDVMMPGMSGYDICRQLRAQPSTALLPVIMVTSLDARKERVAGIEAGADDFLSRPFNPPELLARVRSLLRIKALQDRTTRQAEELAEWNLKLESRVDEQVAQLERLGRLKGFFAPQLAELIVSGGPNDILAPHRREVAVMFLDLRGFTAFTTSAAPDEVMRVLAEYHAVAGERVFAHQGAIERFAGDAMMAFFNDPILLENAAASALAAAVEIRNRIVPLRERWKARGHDLDLGIGLALGEATLGAIGCEQRQDYAAIGTVTNLAARLCERAKKGEILVDRALLDRVRDQVSYEPGGEHALKGFPNPVEAVSVQGFRHAPPQAPQAARAATAIRTRQPSQRQHAGNGEDPGPMVVSRAMVEQLAGLGVVRSFPANMIIVNEGDASDSLYVIVSGRVKVFVSDEEGRQMVLGEQGPGEFFGEIVLDAGPRSASVMTAEPSRLAVISQHDFRLFCASHPAMAMMLVGRLIQRVRQLTENVKNLALMDVYGRVARLLLELAREDNGRQVIDPRPTQQDIAIRVGASREMISRILKDLAVGGYIRVEGPRLVIERQPPRAW